MCFLLLVAHQLSAWPKGHQEFCHPQSIGPWAIFDGHWQLCECFMEAAGWPCWSLAVTPVPTPYYGPGDRDMGCLPWCEIPSWFSAV